MFTLMEGGTGPAEDVIAWPDRGRVDSHADEGWERMNAWNR